MRERFVRWYGADPLQALALLGCFALAGYVAWRLSGQPAALRMLVWFVGAAVAHDLVLYPLYALADRSVRPALRGRRGRPGRPAPRVPPLNYLRAPALGAGLLLLLFLPGIARRGAATYHAATGQTQQPFLGRWLLLTAALFGLSALCYAVRLGRAARRG